MYLFDSSDTWTRRESVVAPSPTGTSGTNSDDVIIMKFLKIHGTLQILKMFS